MSDPTIQIPSCRGDGVCRLCGLRASDQFGYNLPCGCYWHLSCGEEQSRTRAQHLSDLLTEALRQRDAIQQGISSEVAMLREDVARLRATAALRVEERDAAIRERDQERRERTVLVIKWQGAAAKAAERAERAEALLRKCVVYLELGSGGKVLLAKIREVLYGSIS